MKIAEQPGSFDSVTLGHVDMTRASKLFDKVIVFIYKPCQTASFTAEERVR